jgi:hypothetical protein
MASAVAILLILTALGRSPVETSTSVRTPALGKATVSRHLMQAPLPESTPETDLFILFAPFGSQP